MIELQSMLKEMLKNGVEALLEAEMDEKLGYKRYDHQTPKTNYRNGSSKKRVRTDLGELDLNIPRDREGEFEPQLVPKNTRDLSAIEDKVISMYGKGITQRDIYGLPLSAQSISRMTDKILPVIDEWQQRPLNKEYYFVFMETMTLSKVNP